MTPAVDGDTADDALQTRARHSGRRLNLVFSDEFEESGRSFGAGDDRFIEALEKPDYSNQAIQFYNASREYVTTKDGSLVLMTRAVKTTWEVGRNAMTGERVMETKNYTSGMIQTWNKFCYTGGVLEMAIELPGSANSGGLWPAAWLMGNLARATFDKTTIYKWPWSYDRCDGGVQDLETKQEINACSAAPGHGMHPHQGRGAPEIDIFEVMPGHNMPGHEGLVKAFMSSSLQVAPGIDSTRNRPKNGEKLGPNTTWYSSLEYNPSVSALNDGFWGAMCGPVEDPTPRQEHKYQEDAISVNTDLNQTHFDSMHVYRLEWEPGSTEGGGYIEWYLDDDFIFGISGDDLAATTGAMIPAEPMYLILNTAISHRWGMPEPCDIAHCPMCWRCYDCTNPDCQCTLPDGMKGCKNLPAEMRIDYIRLYQDADNQKHTVGCSPPGYPTSEYIAAHQEDYAPWRATPQALILSDADWNIVLGLLAASSLALLGCCVWLILRVPAKKGAAAPTDRTRLIDPKGNSSGNSNRMRPIPTAHTSARDPVHQYQKL